MFAKSRAGRTAGKAILRIVIAMRRNRCIFATSKGG
jgi:hypothetical protein